MVLVHLADAPARDGAAKTGLVRHQVFLAVTLARGRHGFGRDVLGAFELVVAVVAGWQGTGFVDHIHQHLRTVGGQALTGDPVLGQHLLGGADRLHETFRVLDVANTLGATHGNRLQVLAAHHGADTRAAGCAVQVVHHAGKQHAVFSRLADARYPGQRVLQRLLEGLLGLPDTLAPQMRRVAQLDLVVIDIEVHRLRALALEDQHVPAGHLELGTPITTRIRAGHGAGQRALGDHGVTATRAGHGACQRPGSPDDLVVGRQRVHLGIHLFHQVFGAQATRADVGTRPVHIGRLDLDGAGGQIDAEDFSSP